MVNYFIISDKCRKSVAVVDEKNQPKPIEERMVGGCIQSFDFECEPTKSRIDHFIVSNKCKKITAVYK